MAEIALDDRSVFTAYVRDLTEQKAVEAELSRQREALYQSTKLSALGTLMASISHELKNPLSVVVGQSMLLKEAAGDADLIKRADRIGIAAERCAGIVRNFLDMARQRPAVKATVEVNAIVGSTLELTRHLLKPRHPGRRRHPLDSRQNKVS